MKYLKFILILLVVSPLYGQISFDSAFQNLSFSSPIDIQFTEGIPDSMFIAERQGIIKQVLNQKIASASTVFLDIRSKISTRGEGGLLGFTFHPDYSTNGLLYLSYTMHPPFQSIISEVNMNTGAETILIELTQPYENHNGGQIRFGPDGYLYIAFGDGGSGGDPLGHGQNRSSLHGNILRIDVDNTLGDLNYGIPSDNPFIGNSEGWREEIFAYGFRNPFRFSFDKETDDLWVADVGQNRREEVNLVVSGGNYGWKTMEGSLCYSPANSCNQSGLELPFFEYGLPGSQSITGGFVYRGEQNQDLHGYYLFGDFTSGDIWRINTTVDSNVESIYIGSINNFQLTCFGEDHQGELYMCSFGGQIYKFDMGLPTSIDFPGLEDLPSKISLAQNYPNPFNPVTVIRYAVGEGLETNSQIRLSVFDMLGREVAVLFDGTKSPGKYDVTFDAATLSSGTYMYRLSTDDNVEIRKMMLIK